MELGATVCSVKSPSCSTCPVRTSCLAHKLTVAEPKGPKPEASSGEGVTPTAGRRGKGGKPISTDSSEEKTPLSDEQTCGCAVCEVGEDRMAVVPVAVTDYPRKAAKT